MNVRLPVKNEFAVPAAFDLDSKYTSDTGTIVLSGVQALVRLTLDQHRSDRRRGLRTAMLVSGYRGSPLGGLDMAFERAGRHVTAHDVVVLPALNEELAATAIFGSQLAHTFAGPKFDGVLGMWYGKGPGVDRTGDAFRHGNVAGIGKNGGVLVVAGDDPGAKSSTIPSGSEVALFDAQMPVLYPGSVQEVLDLGLKGYALSRFSGSWVGLKIVTDVADAFSTVVLREERYATVVPEFDYRGRAWHPRQNPALLAPWSLEQEREIHEGRLQAARLFAASNGVNRIAGARRGAWLGVVAAGKTYFDVAEALARLGLDDDALERSGIRLLKLGMLYPLEPGIVRTFADGLEEIVVIEEKRAFIELLLRDVLYDLPDRPRIVGKRDEHGDFFVPGHGELGVDGISELLRRRLLRRVPPESLTPPRRGRGRIDLPILGDNARRTPYFCSGCPHNRSTEVPDGSVANGAVGCSTMAMWMDRATSNIVQMGGEGVQWVGAAPFTDMPHIFQNMGDGTYLHSGALAIRQAVAAKTTITYKLLYNDAVAMTGGQRHDAPLDVQTITRELTALGVAKIIVVSDNPRAHRGRNARLPDGVAVWARDRLDEAQLVLRDTQGVTILVYDQPCAADLRRQRKRGLAPEPARRVVINEAVCEGCGDCGRKSNCLSVWPTDTEFGRKTQIDQSSCNKDYSCLDGNCPAFVTVVPDGQRPRPTIAAESLTDIPAPEQRVRDAADIVLVGIGGSGVVTVNQILGTAAHLDGKYVRALDQTGLAQKGGSVVSHLRIVDTPVEASSKVAVGGADTYIVFDLLTAVAPENLKLADPATTIAVVSIRLAPTGPMIRGTTTEFPDHEVLRNTLDASTRSAESVFLDADKVSELLFTDTTPANLLLTGAAYQTGVIPLSASALEQAIQANGGNADRNILAFRVGRKIVADPGWLDSLDAPSAAEPNSLMLSTSARATIEAVGADGELLRLLEVRVPELIAYQDLAYARSYAATIKEVLEAERSVSADADAGPLAKAVARSLFKLMAYKDEYEVARLHRAPSFEAELARQFGATSQRKYLLHPPALKSLGLHRKIAFGRWGEIAFWVLRRARKLRGTVFDPFGRDPMRRLERSLVVEYQELIRSELLVLSPTRYARAVRLAALPDMIRGYDEVKLQNVARYRAALEELNADPEKT